MQGEYYIEELPEGFGVFNTDNVEDKEADFCFALYATEVQAQEYIDKLTK